GTLTLGMGRRRKQADHDGHDPQPVALHPALPCLSFKALMPTSPGSVPLRSLRPLSRTVIHGHDVQPLWQGGDGSSASGDGQAVRCSYAIAGAHLRTGRKARNATNPFPPQFVGHRDECVGECGLRLTCETIVQSSGFLDTYW